MIGRRSELSMLSVLLERLARREPSWAQISGEPGIGKTRLALEVAEQADRARCLVLIGRGAEMEQDVPFGVLAHALDDYLGAQDEDRQHWLAGGHLERLAPALPGLTFRSDRVRPAPGDERYPIYRSLRELLERLAERQPVVLMLDDLHWADSPTLELVNHLLRRPVATPLALLLAWRTGHAPGLAERLREASRDLPGVSVELGPLTEEEVGELLGGGADPVTTRWIYRESGGNPFYAGELGRTASRPPFEGPRMGSQPPPAGDLPAPLRAAIGAEIASLSGPARRLAAGGAVAGEPFDIEVAAGIAELSADEALTALDVLTATQVVSIADMPRRFVFRHPIMRRAVYDSAPAGWRLTAHARAAEILADRGAPISHQAHHVAIAAGPGDTGALDLLIRASAATLSTAPASAAEWLAAGLRLVNPAGAETHLAQHLLTLLADAQQASGDLQNAHTSLERALALAPAGEPGRLRLIAGCAGLEHTLGRWEQARDRLTRALAELPAGLPVEAGTLEIELAVARLFEMDWSGAESSAARAAERVDGIDPVLHATASALRAFILVCSERFDDCASVLESATPSLDRLADADLTRRVDAAYFLGRAELLLERFGAARLHLTRSLDLATASGRTRSLVPTMFELAKTLAEMGRIRDAVELSESAVDISRLSGNDWVLTMALAAQAKVLTLQGSTDEARQANEQALTLVPDVAPTYRLELRRQLALIELEAGDARTCVELLAPAGASSLRGVEPGTRYSLYEALVRAHLIAGNLGEAKQCTENAEAMAPASLPPVSTARLRRCRAAVDLATGELEAATKLASAAYDLARNAGANVEAAKSLVLVGASLAESGRRSAAVEILTAAAQELADYGARRASDAAAHQLRRLGQRPLGPRQVGLPGDGMEALSSRELEVSRLVASGRTNREIAAALFISEKTVETHLRRTFQKVGVRTRAALAAAIERDRSSRIR